MSGTEIPADEYYELVIFPPDDWSERMVETFAERIAGELAPAVMMTLQKRPVAPLRRQTNCRSSS